MFPFGEPPAVTHSSTSLRLPSVRGKKGLGVRSKKELGVRSWKDSDVRGSTSSGMWQAMWKCAILPHAKYMWGRLSENSFDTIILSSRSRGISRHVPVDLVRWLDFARHDRMIAADRFSDSLWGYKSVYKKEGKFRKTLHLFVRDVPRCKVRQNIG